MYTTFGVKSLVNEGFEEGLSTYAYNVTCQVKPEPKSDKERNMIVTVYELAPYANTEKYCLYIENNQMPAKCSGSRAFITKHGPYNSSTGWTFSMSLSESAEPVPYIRFWVTIASESLIYYIFVLI